MAAFRLPSCLSAHLPSASSLRLPNMLSIASLFDDEQRLLNRLWMVLLGLEALLVLIGAVSAIVQGVVAMRLRRRRRQQQTAEKAETAEWTMSWPDAQPPRSPKSPGAARKRVTIVLPATVFDDLPRPTTPMNRSPDLGPSIFDSPAAKV